MAVLSRYIKQSSRLSNNLKSERETQHKKLNMISQMPPRNPNIKRDPKTDKPRGRNLGRANPARTNGGRAQTKARTI